MVPQTTSCSEQSLCLLCVLNDLGSARKEQDSLTIERLNAKKGHEKQNCVLACNSCNLRAKSIPQAIMQSGYYGPNLKYGIMKWCPGPLHNNDEDKVCMAGDFYNSSRE